MRRKLVIVVVSICCIIGILIHIISLNYSSMERVYSNDNMIAADYDTYGLDKEVINMNGSTCCGEFKLSGSYTIWKYECDQDKEIAIEGSLLVTDGKAKLVLISPDNEVITLASNDEEGSNDIPVKKNIALKKGTNRIKLVAKSKANVEFELRIDKGSFKSPNIVKDEVK